MGWTFYNSSGQRLSSSLTSIANIDIDGGTDIGADIVDADLFIIDDGAGGTNRKTEASRIKTYAGTSQANQAALEAETNEDTYAPPDLIKHSPGVAKAWAGWTVTGGIDRAYNVSTITDSGVGDWTANLTNAISTSPVAAGMVFNDGADMSQLNDGEGTTSISIVCFDFGAGANVDPVRARLVVFGDA